MKTMTKGLFGLLAVLAFTLGALAQGERQMSMMTEIVVDPAQQQEFEAQWKKIKAMAKENGYSHPTYVSQWRNTYWLSTPISSYTDLDTVIADRGKVWEAAGEPFHKAIADFDAAQTGGRSWVVQRSDELSYKPKDGEIVPEDFGIIEIDPILVKPGKVDRFYEMLREYKAMAAEKGVKTGYNVMIGRMGAETGSVAFIRYSKDAVTLEREKAEAEALFEGDERMTAMFTEFLNEIAAGETTQPFRAWPRRDLSMNVDGDSEASR